MSEKMPQHPDVPSFNAIMDRISRLMDTAPPELREAIRETNEFVAMIEHQRGVDDANAAAINLLGQIMHAIGKSKLVITEAQRASCPAYVVTVNHGAPPSPITIAVELASGEQSARVH